MTPAPVATEREFFFPYRDQQIPYSVWLSPDTAQVETILYLGTVQVGEIPRWVAELCPSGTVVVQGAPHWYAQEDGSDIPEFMFAFAHSVFDSVRKAFTFDRVDVIAESQAVPGAVGLFGRDAYIEYLGHLIIVQPLGFTALAFCEADKERIKVFRQRIVANLRHQIPAIVMDHRLRSTQRQMLKMVNLRDAKVWAQYNSGLRYDALGDLKTLLAKTTHVTVLCGARDRLFPPHEIEESLRRFGVELKVQTIAGVPHSPLATRWGRKLLQAAFLALSAPR